jgi:hypothetical protein
MVMRRAGKASPEAISAERTRSRASVTGLVRQADNGKGGHSWRNLHLYVDRAHLDASNATVATRWTISAHFSPGSALLEHL